MQPVGLKSRVVSGTVYGDMYLNCLLGSIARVAYSIPVPNLYLVLYMVFAAERALNEFINQSIQILHTGLGLIL